MNTTRWAWSMAAITGLVAALATNGQAAQVNVRSDGVRIAGVASGTLAKPGEQKEACCFLSGGYRGYSGYGGAYASFGCQPQMSPFGYGCRRSAPVYSAPCGSVPYGSSPYGGYGVYGAFGGAPVISSPGYGVQGFGGPTPLYGAPSYGSTGFGVSGYGPSGYGTPFNGGPSNGDASPGGFSGSPYSGSSYGGGSGSPYFP